MEGAGFDAVEVSVLILHSSRAVGCESRSLRYQSLWLVSASYSPPRLSSLAAYAVPFPVHFHGPYSDNFPESKLSKKASISLLPCQGFSIG